MPNSTPPIQMVDLKGQYRRLKTEIDKAMATVMAHGRFINGPEVIDFAVALANYLDVPHVVPCANGTDALQIALMALELNPGDEVITSSFSFVSAAEVIALLGLKPVLVDVKPGTFNLCPESVKAAITPKTRAVIPVHLYGQGAAMEEIMLIARAHNLYVVEDAAQSLGAQYRYEGRWRMLGTIGHIGCTSFFPSKNLGCYGDGGALMTHDDNLAAKMSMITTHGARRKYYNEMIGLNSRLDTLQAAVLLTKLPHLTNFNRQRRRAAEIYHRRLRGLPHITLPAIDPLSTHVYNQFTIRVSGGKRDALKNFLASHSIPSMVYYPNALHVQPAFSNISGVRSPCPVSEQLGPTVLSLPMHTELSDNQVASVCSVVASFVEKNN